MGKTYSAICTSCGKYGARRIEITKKSLQDLLDYLNSRITFKGETTNNRYWSYIDIWENCHRNNKGIFIHSKRLMFFQIKDFYD